MITKVSYIAEKTVRVYNDSALIATGLDISKFDVDGIQGMSGSATQVSSSSVDLTDSLWNTGSLLGLSFQVLNGFYPGVVPTIGVIGRLTQDHNISRFPPANSNPQGEANNSRAISTIQSSVIFTIPVWDTLPASRNFFGETIMIDGGSGPSFTYIWDSARSVWQSLVYGFTSTGGTFTDTQLVQACMDQNKPIPPGSYLISDTLYLEKKYGVNISGAGMNSTKLVWNGSAGGVLLHLHGIVAGLVSGFSMIGNGTAGTSIDLLVTSPSDYGSSGITFNNLSISGAHTLVQMALADGEINNSDMDYGPGNFYSNCNKVFVTKATQAVTHRFHGGYAFGVADIVFDCIRGGSFTVNGFSVAGSDGKKVLHIDTNGGGNNNTPFDLVGVRAERMTMVASESIQGVQVNLWGGAQASMTSQADTPSIVISGRTKVLATGTLLFGAATTSGTTAQVILNNCQLPAGFIHNASVSGSGNLEIFNMGPIVL